MIGGIRLGLWSDTSGGVLEICDLSSCIGKIVLEVSAIKV
jgi:hypothetical protein